MNRQRELEAIYASLPDVPCTGRCHESCSFIGVLPVERTRMRHHGIEPPQITDAPCRHLTFANRCNVHADRPLVCRLYGATPKLTCPFGCVPERWLTDDEASEIFKRVQALGPPDPETAMLAHLISEATRR